jgi:hypothetical protein
MKLEPPPREAGPGVVRAIKKDRKILGLTGLILMASGAGIAVVFYFFMVPPHMEALDDTGATATGTIDSIRWNRNVNYGNRHPLVVSYHFTAETGATYYGSTESLDVEKLQRYQVGDEIPISYDRWDPGINKIAGVKIAAMPLWVMVFPAAEFAVGVIFFVLNGIRRNRAVSLYVDGVEVEGEIVVAKLLRTVNMGWKHPVSIGYGFDDEMGDRVLSKVWSWHKGAREFKEGQKCTVLYDRENPARSILYDSIALYLE